MKKIQCIIYEDNGQFVAHCLNTGVASQGDTYEEAVKNIKEAMELYLEDDDGDYIPITGGITLTEQFING
ncbi:MAG: type II toxin-antitoxin system HicB family antitoxin [Pseudomonadota bacterium]|nr:type II toxin-antitoxin system HicB family antitoxin [Pseudomonadota bacterium]MDE3038363.1 type II toxin-antitoxin system HicB family antitoxin [Pseudomonadota bacterium]